MNFISHLIPTMFVVLFLCLIAGSFADTSSEQWNKALRFPEKVSTNNYIKLNPDFSSVTTAVSVCTVYLDEEVPGSAYPAHLVQLRGTRALQRAHVIRLVPQHSR